MKMRKLSEVKSCVNREVGLGSHVQSHSPLPSPVSRRVSVDVKHHERKRESEHAAEKPELSSAIRAMCWQTSKSSWLSESSQYQWGFVSRKGEGVFLSFLVLLTRAALARTSPCLCHPLTLCIVISEVHTKKAEHI